MRAMVSILVAVLAAGGPVGAQNRMPPIPAN